MSQVQESDTALRDEHSDARARRILVAEDSSVTQDLLKLVLGQRGHSVDIVADGRAALDALRAEQYDVALLDFKMPEMNGLEVVVALMEETKSKRRPHFVAITGDVEGLLKSPSNCEHFDRVLPKPLDINMVCEVIEELADGASDSIGGERGTVPNAAWDEHAPVAERTDPGRTARRRSPLENLDYRFLRFPDDMDRRAPAARIVKSGEGPREYDAILVCAPARTADLVALWNGRGLHLLPIIDLTATLGGRADLNASTLVSGDTETVRDLIEAFHDRRAGLHRDLIHSNEPGDKLLGRIHVSGDDLTPRLDGTEPGFVSYNTILDPQTLHATAVKLVEEGLLDREFFDRLHVCANCSSARFNVREECPECGGARLDEVSYLHHFRCAYQGPEPDFRRGDDLICPKCRREMRHFGSDYDRPGMMVVCTACGNGTSEPTVGFICVDCNTRYDGDTVRTRDVFAYTLTDQAIGYLEAGQSFLGLAQRTLRFTDLPLDLVIALNAAAKHYNDTGTPFSLLNIAYEDEREITRQHGPRQFGQIRSLFLETLQQALGDGAKVARSQSFDFALLENTDPEEIRAGLDDLRQRAGASLRHDPGAVITVFGPADIA